MLQRIFPARLDNQGYGGRAAALWLFALLLALKLVMGVNGTLNARTVAAGADGIRLGGPAAGAADTILELFRALSLSHLPLVAIGVAVLVRWRAMVPFLYLVLLADQLARRLVAAAYAAPREETGAPGSVIVLVILAMLVAGFLLSLWQPRRRTD